MEGSEAGENGISGCSLRLCYKERGGLRGKLLWDQRALGQWGEVQGYKGQSGIKVCSYCSY